MKTEIDYTKGYLTENEIRLIKNRLNMVQCSEKLAEETKKAFYDNMPEDGYKLTEKQTQKGLSWLMDQWKTPKGKERKHNPFGYREQHVLENFKEFRLIDFYNAANYYQTQVGIKAHFPYYWVIGNDGSEFQYVMHSGQIHILG